MWFIFALATGLIYAIYYICNQESKLNSNMFIIYRGLLMALAATPFALFFWHIFPWQFYAIALCQGFVISYSDAQYFKVFQKFGAENVNAIKPLTIMVTFIFWLIIDPSIIFYYLSVPVRTLIILASLGAIIFAVIKYQGQKIGADCLKYVVPLLILTSIIDTSNKVITRYSEGYLLSLTIHRVVITGYIIGLINLWKNRTDTKLLKQLVQLKNIRSGSFVLLGILSMMSVNLSMHYTPNPAYTSAVIHLSVIWIMLINNLRAHLGFKVKHKPIKRRWILLLLSGAISLILVTN